MTLETPGRLRVAHITGCLEMGGQENLLVEFARHADRDRFDLRFLSLADKGPLAAALEVEGWPVTALNTPEGLRPGLILRVARWLKENTIDVIHTHNNRPLIYAAPASRLAGVRRLIHTRHGQGVGISSRQAWLTALAARWADAFVCVSQDSARMAQEEGVPANKVRILWNGIDTKRFSFSGPQRDGPAVLVARLTPEKDAATLLRAVALVRQSDPGFRLEIAGLGPSIDDLEKLSELLGLGDCVRFLGIVRDVPALLGRASMLVLSSLSEGIPLTVLEAMARGLPVVATKVGGIPEAVEDCLTGILVPPRDPDALAEAMSTLRGRPTVARALGRAGRERVEQHFDIRRMVSAYEALYLQPRITRMTRMEREQPKSLQSV
ncbi:MAG: glycosyltransferase [Gemmataceae bacterium]|nr:glycosyltransferase [Gemmataceae bacterium]MCI0739337.1 glycosyltransferase [Gemmataceae bacterium]